MEKTEENIMGLAKKVFETKWFAGRIARGKKIAHEKDKHWIEVWSKGLVPRLVVKIHPKNDAIYVKSRGYLEMAREFDACYKAEFEIQHTMLIKLYD